MLEFLNKIQTDQRLKRMLFIMAKHNMQILGGSWTLEYEPTDEQHRISDVHTPVASLRESSSAFRNMLILDHCKQQVYRTFYL